MRPRAPSPRRRARPALAPSLQPRVGLQRNAGTGEILMMTASRDTLHSTRDARILSHTDLPRRLAARVARHAPASIDLEDLIAAGTEGLIQAAQRFDEAAGVPFGPFARRRVHGAILDLLRAEDHLSRGERRRAREGLEQHLPHATAVVALDDAGEIAGDPRNCPLASALRSEARGRLAAAVATLSRRSQRMLWLYHGEELTLREIGQVFEVTESRVCQLLRAAHDALRGQLVPPTAPHRSRPFFPGRRRGGSTPEVPGR